MSATSVRRAALDDVPQMSAVFEALDAHHIELRPDLFKRLDRPARDDETLRTLISNVETQAVLVADDKPSASLIGFVHVLEKHWPESVVTPATRSADIDAIFVHSAFRRRGIGNLLISAAELWAQERNLTQLTLSVRAFNHEAITAYQRAGFDYVAHRLARTCGGLAAPRCPLPAIGRLDHIMGCEVGGFLKQTAPAYVQHK